MLSKPLLKQTIKSNYKLFLCFVIMVIGLMSVEWQVSILIVPAIYEIILSSRLVAKFVDRGSMAYLLSSTNRRSDILFTQGVYMVGSLALGFIFVAGWGIAAELLALPGEWETGHHLLLSAGAFLLHLFISGMSFFISCIVKRVRTSVCVGVGLTMVLFIVEIVIHLKDKLEILELERVWEVFCEGLILHDNMNLCLQLPILAIVGIGLYMAGIKTFKKRDLPL